MEDKIKLEIFAILEQEAYLINQLQQVQKAKDEKIKELNEVRKEAVNVTDQHNAN